jgi:CHASE2 domain-containing sensor protein
MRLDPFAGRIWIISPRTAPDNLDDMSQLGGHRSFWRHLLRSFPVFVVITLVTLVFEHAGWLRSFETTALDTWLRLRKPINPQFVCVVTINDDDYLRIFGGKSPLDPKTVMTLVSAVADGNPAVIGVDIDTSDAQWQTIVPELQPLFRGRTFIVWE